MGRAGIIRAASAVWAALAFLLTPGALAAGMFSTLTFDDSRALQWPAAWAFVGLMWASPVTLLATAVLGGWNAVRPARLRTIWMLALPLAHLALAALSFLLLTGGD